MQTDEKKSAGARWLTGADTGSFTLMPQLASYDAVDTLVATQAKDVKVVIVDSRLHMEDFLSDIPKLEPTNTLAALPPSSEEKMALRIAEGDEPACAEMEECVRRGDQARVLPVLFILRRLWKRDGTRERIGDFALRALGACIDESGTPRWPAIAGGLLSLVALHKPSSLTGAVKRTFGDRAVATTVLEGILALRNLLR